MEKIVLFSTDFDGTLVGFGDSGRCPDAFAEVIVELKRRGGLWAINTGRTLDHAVEGVLRFEAPDVPDFLLTNEREVFRRCPENGWASHGTWNEICTARHTDLYDSASGILDEIERLSRRTKGVRPIYENDLLGGLVTESEELMDSFLVDLESALRSHSDLSYQRNTIYLRFCHRDYHKGTALEELCRLEGVSAATVLAAGDHYNDLPMLDAKYAGYTACPSNAIPAVREQVTRMGGYIATTPWASGVAEAFHHFETLTQGA